MKLALAIYIEDTDFEMRFFRSQMLRLPSVSPSTSVSAFHAMALMVAMLPCNRCTFSQNKYLK